MELAPTSDYAGFVFVKQRRRRHCTQVDPTPLEFAFLTGADARSVDRVKEQVAEVEFHPGG